MLPARLNRLTEVMTISLQGSFFSVHHIDISLPQAMLECFTYHSLFFSKSAGIKTTKALYLCEGWLKLQYYFHRRFGKYLLSFLGRLLFSL